jgi:flagellar biosynthesis/type III secretory pathway chaperone
MNTDEQLKRLIATVARLTSLLHEENEKLSQPGRVKGLKEIVTEKETLGRTYEQQIKALGNEEAMKKLNPELLQRLKEACQPLAQLMDENKRKLEMKMEATKQVFKIIAEAAKEFRQASAVYGNTGAAGLDPRMARKAYRPAVSVGVNREL